MFACISQSDVRPSRRNARHEGFTLIELLMVISIIGVLATFIMVAMAGVNQSAKEDRTTAQITKIHELLMDKYQSYQYRRMPHGDRRLASLEYSRRTNQITQQAYQDRFTQGGGYRWVAQDRLTATREMMRLELPCTIDEVLGPHDPDRPQCLLLDPLRPSVRSPLIPALSRAYYSRVLAATNNSVGLWTPDLESAECLYLILSQMRDAESSALEFFSENEIGDTDGDGMNEILDGWGRPIFWQRWLPGFVSTLQKPLAQDTEQEDMFDPMQVGLSYQPSFPTNYPRALFPLIFSAGPDGNYGIHIMKRGAAGGGWFAHQSDPYVDHPEIRKLGNVTDIGGRKSMDNITNHLLSTR